jgi:hypothetical protein
MRKISIKQVTSIQCLISVEIATSSTSVTPKVLILDTALYSFRVFVVLFIEQFGNFGL